MVEVARKQLFRACGAVGALKVVVVDDGSLGIGIATDRDGRASRWTADPCDVELLETRQGVAVLEIGT